MGEVPEGQQFYTHSRGAAVRGIHRDRRLHGELLQCIFQEIRKDILSKRQEYKMSIFQSCLQEN